MKLIAVVLIACFASTFASQMNVNLAQQKGLIDFVVNAFGLQSVWAEIQTLGSNLVTQLQSELTQLLFAGQEKWQQAQALFNTLVYNLTNHIGDASTIVIQAINALAQILSNQNSKRGINDFIVNLFGLQNVWAEIQTLGSNLVAQLQSELTQLLFAGQEKWQQAQQIFNTLVYNLTNHIGDASLIVIQAVNALAQILSKPKW